MISEIYTKTKKTLDTFRIGIIRKPEWVYRSEVWLPCRTKGISDKISDSIFSGYYEQKELKIVASHLSDKDVVLELGAGIGCMSSFCAKRIGSSQVHAIEANPSLIPLIRATFTKNNVNPSLYNMMLGRGSGKSEIFISEDFWESSTLEGSPNTKQVEIIRRDTNEILREIKPSFLIVDIEGGEADLFDYADLTGVQKICLETHEDIIGNEKTTKVFQNILEQGFMLDFHLIYRNVFFFYRQ